MIEIRKLAALDLHFLGAKFILAEFGLAVLCLPALGLLTLFRSHSIGQTIFGIYLLSLGANYLPLLLYAIVMVRRRSALSKIIHGGHSREGGNPVFSYATLPPISGGCRMDPRFRGGDNQVAFSSPWVGRRPMEPSGRDRP